MKFFKKLFFLEASPLVEKGKSKILQESDMLSLPEHLHPKTEIFNEDELNWSSPWKNLWSVIRISRPELKHAYTWYILSALFSLSSPVLVNRFVSAISIGITPVNVAQTMMTGVLLGMCGFLTGFCLQHYFYHALGAYQIVTNILNKILFSHSLKLSMQARGKNQLGDIVNYMSSDSDAIADFTFVFGDLAYNILMIVGVIGMLFYFLGLSAIAALVSFFMLAPLTSYVAKRFTKLEEEMMSFRDKRVTLMTQAMNAIRVVKYFAWEKSIEKEVMDIRDQELASRKKLARSEVLSGLGYMTVSTIVLFIALATHALRGQKIDAALIFTCVSLFGLIEGPFGDLSHLISRCTNGYVGAGRLIKFLKQETLQDSKVDAEVERTESAGVEFSHVSAYYEDSQLPVLQNISFELKNGESLAIVGPVGSGKSSLLYTILGETKIKEGKVQFSGGRRPLMSYLPQEAYIINSTLLENIVFGESVTEDDIQQAILLSCLSSDLLQMSGGLQTEIGEKGVNLSGGQKQRVGLARAYLSRPDLILLDDPLSAVDHDTENKLCDQLLFGAWKNKTRIVVTHRLEHLKSFDKILFLQNGKVEGYGTFEELQASSVVFNSFYAEHSRSHGTHEKVDHVQPEQKDKSKTDKLVRITEDEDREVGAVKKDIYFDYIRSLGGDDKKTRPWILICLFAGALLVALAPLSQKAWLSYFTSHQDSWNPLNAIGIYGMIGLLVLVLSLLNNFFWLERGIKAGKNMHDNMLKSVLAAPVRFFDSTPVGRIIQRFSRDIESVDVYLQWSFISVVNCLLQIAVSVFLILALVPFMIVVIAPVLYAYYIVQKNYRSPAREAKRFDSVARSPRYSHFKETLQGLVVIRSFSKQKWFMESFFNKLAESQRMFYSHYMLNRWFSSRIPMIGGLISMSTAIGITISAYNGWMTAGTAGLVTIYSLSFWGYLNWGVRMFADIESRMTSIERLKFFASLPGEHETVKASANHLPEYWPPRGAVRAENIKVKYAAHLPFVLKGITFDIEAGSKVGIVGRTGSGKSTLFQTLFRFIELEEGSLFIDGVDIATVPLERLRKSIAVIPQDPTLFMGTIRNNLDRYHEYSDEQVIAVLKHSGLWSMVEELPEKLNAPVLEGGSNFSQGQRQLLCLSRALLIKAKIIVMDEATASVDVQTDALLQKVIREELQGITMLIIAHRLGTVKDCDQIIEIQNGLARTIRRSEVTADVIA